MRNRITFYFLLLTFALFMGCAGIENFLCSNRVTIENDVTAAQAAIAAVQAEFGSVIPVEGQAIIAAANLVISTGENILNNEVCPTAAEVQSVENAAAALDSAKAQAGWE
ncbi:MAG: hypothetical protein ACLP7A_07990 [Desulfobaccales bacterium]